jgi:tRNA (cytidine/uridine-2'-O-)-methyltransferase
LFHIVLVEPEIPANTGNISRTCSASGAKLHLVKPLGFSLEDKYLKRAGLDYWEGLNLEIHENFDAFYEKYGKNTLYFATTKAKQVYSDPNYHKDCFFLFGKETKGLPESLLKQNVDHLIRIPMLDEKRSLNLSNSVAIVLYEAHRQNGFFKLQKKGNLGGVEDA